MSGESPYISFVVTSRNDNHGGDMTSRMAIFMRGLIDQCEKHKLPAEVVFVEWNPPSEKPRLQEVLPAPISGGYLSVRYVLVPKEMHERHEFSERLPLFQMIAKNVGIRRAKAPFILCTNIDLLFSDPLFAFLASKALKEGHYYRANRCDIPKEIDGKKSTDELLEWAESSVIKILGKSADYPNFRDTTSFLFRYWRLIPMFRMLSRLKTSISTPQQEMVNAMDTDACGDFTLMHKNDWDRILGYPELEVYSLHIDSMGLFAANAVGIKQVILPWNQRTYHISHQNGWEFSSKKDKVMFYTNKPVLDWWAVFQWGLELLDEQRTFDVNDAQWGLANEHLEEVTLA